MMENKNNSNDHDIEDIVIEPPCAINHNHDTTNATTSTTSSASESFSSSLFFADATLDLTVAHDIADTPEAKQHRRLMRTTTSDNNNTNNTITANHNNQQQQQSQSQQPFEWIPPPLPFTSNTNTDTNTNRVLLSEEDTNVVMDVVKDDDHLEEEPVEKEIKNPPNRISNFDSIISSASSTTVTEIETNHHHSSSLPLSSSPSPSNRIQNQNHNNNTNRIIPPKYPRDLFWVIFAILIIPISLLYPIVIMKGGSTSSILSNDTTTTNSTNITTTNTNSNNNVLAHHPLSFATIHAITWTILVCIFMIRLLYRNSNNYNNYSSSNSTSTTSSINMAVLLTALAPLSIFIYFLLTLTVLYICLFETNTNTTTWWIIVFIPFLLWIREIFLYRTYWTRLTDSINDMGYISRTTFFHELYTMSITEIILQKSKLQQRRLIRIVSTILIGQGMMILLWRTSLLHVLNHNNNSNSSSSSTSSLTFLMHVGYIWIIGVWCTSCITKCLNYLVSSAILLWSMEQSERLIQLQQQQQQQQVGTTAAAFTTDENENDDEDEDGSSILSRHSRNSIPEAYRTVDASVYQSVSFQMDDLHLDDDDDDDDHAINGDDDDHHDDMEYQPQRRMDSNATYTYLNGSRGRNKSISQQQQQLGTTHPRMTDTNNITMKSMIRMGLRMNLGSIIYCGTVSNISQWIYTHLQYLDYIRQQRQQYRQQQSSSNNNTNNNNHSTGGFQGMVIGHGDTSTTTIYYHRIAMIGSMIRYYVQYHNDLPMTHVATYYKSYTRATRDVTSIIQESGLEPILQEDITRQICASICSTISGVIVLITTYLLLHQRKNSVNSADITELHVAETMFLSYMYSYTLLHTAFEPIRAAIQASYIAFAQNPHCFLHTYPLIYHRLSRLSSATVATTA